MEVEAQFQVDTEIAASFKEVATQGTFLSLSTSQRQLSEAVKLSHSLLKVRAAHCTHLRQAGQDV